MHTIEVTKDYVCRLGEVGRQPYIALNQYKVHKLVIELRSTMYNYVHHDNTVWD